MARTRSSFALRLMEAPLTGEDAPVFIAVAIAEHHDDVPLLMLEGNRAMSLVDFHGVDVHGNRVQYWNGGVFTLDGTKFRQYRVIFDTGELPEWIRRKKGRPPVAKDAP